METCAPIYLLTRIFFSNNNLHKLAILSVRLNWKSLSIHSSIDSRLFTNQSNIFSSQLCVCVVRRRFMTLSIDKEHWMKAPPSSISYRTPKSLCKIKQRHFSAREVLWNCISEEKTHKINTKHTACVKSEKVQLIWLLLSNAFSFFGIPVAHLLLFFFCLRWMAHKWDNDRNSVFMIKSKLSIKMFMVECKSVHVGKDQFTRTSCHPVCTACVLWRDEVHS